VALILVLGLLAATPSGKTLLGLTPLLDAASHQGDRITGPLTALWFVIFVLPMFLLTPDRPARLKIGEAVREGLTELKQTLALLPERKNLFAFLIANMIYMDGLVSLFAFGGIYAAGTFGWGTTQIGSFGLLLAIAGTAGAWLGGKLDDRFGPLRVIACSLVVLLASIAVGAGLSRRRFSDRRGSRSVAGRFAHDAGAPCAGRSHHPAFRSVCADRKSHGVPGTADHRYRHRCHEQPESRHGRAAGVLRDGIVSALARKASGLIFVMAGLKREARLRADDPAIPLRGA
jgi:hypothetical protein